MHFWLVQERTQAKLDSVFGDAVELRAANIQKAADLERQTMQLEAHITHVQRDAEEAKRSANAALEREHASRLAAEAAQRFASAVTGFAKVAAE